MRETAFSIGLQGIHKDDVGRVKDIIWSTLETVAKYVLYVCLSVNLIFILCIRHRHCIRSTLKTLFPVTHIRTDLPPTLYNYYYCIED